MLELTLQVAGVIVHKFEINKSTMIIGRGKDADIQVNDATVSNLHAKIETQTDANGLINITLIDLDSTNGSKVNGIKITEQSLRHNDKVLIGETNFILMDSRATPTTIIANMDIDKVSLTYREIQVLELIHQNKQRKEIARDLNLSIHTVSDYLKVIYKKLEVTSKHDAIKAAKKLELI